VGRSLLPSLEPRARGLGIDTGRILGVFETILEHIDVAAAHLARGAGGAAVVPVGPDGPATMDGAIEGARAADGQPLDPADESRAIVCLYEKVNVINLDRELYDPEGILAGARDGGEEEGIRPFSAQRRQPGSGAKRDVNRLSGQMWRPGLVRHARASGRALGPRASTPAAPGARRRELELDGPTTTSIVGHEQLSASLDENCVGLRET